MLPRERRMPLTRRKRTVLPAPGVIHPGHRPGTLNYRCPPERTSAGYQQPGNLIQRSSAGGRVSTFVPVAIDGFGARMSLTEERLMSDTGGHEHSDESRSRRRRAARDIADVPAVEIINTVAVHLMSAAAVKCGLADDPENSAGPRPGAQAHHRPGRTGDRGRPRDRRRARQAAARRPAFGAARVPRGIRHPRRPSARAPARSGPARSASPPAAPADRVARGCSRRLRNFRVRAAADR